MKALEETTRKHASVRQTSPEPALPPTQPKRHGRMDGVHQWDACNKVHLLDVSLFSQEGLKSHYIKVACKQTDIFKDERVSLELQIDWNFQILPMLTHDTYRNPRIYEHLCITAYCFILSSAFFIPLQQLLGVVLARLVNVYEGSIKTF